MSTLIPTTRRSELVPTVGVGLTTRASGDRRLARAVSRLDSQTAMRLASVRNHAIVQTEKIHQIGAIVDEAMTRHAVSCRKAAALAAGDAFVGDDLRFFLDVGRIVSAELISDTGRDFCQEGR